MRHCPQRELGEKEVAVEQETLWTKDSCSRTVQRGSRGAHEKTKSYWMTEL